jgi:hypothetical protein
MEKFYKKYLKVVKKLCIGFFENTEEGVKYRKLKDRNIDRMQKDRKIESRKCWLIVPKIF